MHTEYKLTIAGVAVAAGRAEGVEPDDLTKGNHWIDALRDLGSKAGVVILHDGGVYHPASDSYAVADQKQIDAVITRETLGGVGAEPISVRVIQL